MHSETADRAHSDFTVPGNLTVGTDLSVEGDIQITERQGYYVMSAGDFVPVDNQMAYMTTNPYGFLRGTIPGNDIVFFATLHLPENVTIDSFQAYIGDAAPDEDITLMLSHQQWGIHTVLSTITSSGAQSTAYTIEDNNVGALVSHQGGVRSYRVIASWTTPGPTPGNITMGNVSVIYSYDSLTP